MTNPGDVRLQFAMQPQERTNWCWAAVAASVAAFYQPGTDWTPILVAENELGRSDCCGSRGSRPCNVYWYVNKALARVGHFESMITATASFEEVSAAIDMGRPVGIWVTWRGGGAHFLVIDGVLMNDSYAVDDPTYGESDISELALKTAYQTRGTWKWTYFTK